MISAATVSNLLAIYSKHGWVLRRVLLTPRAAASEAVLLFNKVDIFSSDIDALWFSRPPKSGAVPWELRHLSETPYALVESIDEASPDFLTTLAAVEARLREAVTGRSKSA